MKFHPVNQSNLWELEKSYPLKLNLKRNLSSPHLINLKTILNLKTIPLTMTMISKNKIFALYILVLQMKCGLRNN